MGRGSEKVPPAPAFSPSEIRYGNDVIGKTFLDPTSKAIITQYFPDPAEEERKRIAQARINQIMPTLGISAPELAQQYNQTESAFVEDAKKKFSDQYDPTLRSLREDIASRFGSLNNSSFFDKLNDLEKNKTSAFSDIVNRGKMLKYNLVDQEEARKLREISTLGGILNSDQSNFLNNLQTPLDSSSVLNDFLNSQWMGQLGDFRQDIINRRMLQAQNQNSNNKSWYNTSLWDLF